MICGDRFEQLAIAMAAAYLNRTIAHIEGGDVSGSIDESVRHAITKLAHIHFVTNEDARRRVLAMGEDPAYVFNTGSLDVELASQVGLLPEDVAVALAELGGRRLADGPDVRLGLHAEADLEGEDAKAALVEQGEILFEGERRETPIYDRAALRPGNRFAGPAIVTEFDSTTVVLPGYAAEVDRYSNILITPEGAR